jgi:hypothetical protein
LHITFDTIKDQKEVMKMKKLEKTKYLLIGSFLTLLICFTLPVLAQTIETALNTVNVVVDGVKITSSGDNYILDNGSIIPFSVVYKGTTYLPMRKLAELLGKDVYWDGSTNTVSLSNKQQNVIELNNGQYIVGEDISAGKYDVYVVSGSGNFQGKVSSLGRGDYSLNEILATPDSIWGDSRESYSNLRLGNGDVFTISGGMILRFTKN